MQDLVRVKLNVDTSLYFDDAAKRLALDAEHVILLANPVLPHSEGEIVLTSADPNDHPSIRLNYYDDPHDMRVMRAVVRRALDIAAHWPGNRKIGPVLIPPFLAKKLHHRRVRSSCGPCRATLRTSGTTGRTSWSAPPSPPVGGWAGRAAATHSAVAYVLA